MSRVPSPPVNKWLVAASVSCGSIMGVLDSTIVNVALPQIQGAVGATLQEVTWIATGYTIAAVLLMPLVAFLGRRFGQKRVYLLCLGLFLLGSALCGLSRTLPQLIAFRVLQGLGGGAMQPTEEAILRQTFPKSQQGMAMALTGMIMMVGPALGPVLGGYIVDHLHWSWIFFVSLPIGLLGLVMTWTFVREDPEILAKNRARAAAERTNVDWSGIGLLSTCLATTEFVIEEGQRRYWFDDPLIRVFTFVAVTTFAAFVARQLTAKAPGDEPPPAEGREVRDRHVPERARHVHAHGDHVPALGLHAAGSRFHRDAGGPRHPPDDARDVRRHAHRGRRLRARFPAAHDGRRGSCSSPPAPTS